MSRLVIKFPTRNRREKFKDVLVQYLSFLSGRHDVRVIITMDSDDPTMNNDAMREWLDALPYNAEIQWFYGNSKTKIEAVNADMKGVDGDVLLVASDDMVPVQANYDEIIFSLFEKWFPDFDGAVKFWDGYRPKEDPLMTLAVMGFPLYRRFGYIYHPAYKSLYADDEQTRVCIALGKLVSCDLCIIQHQWVGGAWDELCARNESDVMYAVDGEVFKSRAAKGFDVEQMSPAPGSAGHVQSQCGERG